MVTLAVIAGNQTEDLCSHLEVNCAFKVLFKASSILNAKSDLENSIIKVDKLLYVYQKDQMNVRTDMALLRELFLTDSFFEAKEILFLQKQDSDAAQAEKYFQTIMQDITRKVNSKYGNNSIEYSCKTVQGILTFQEISESLLGVTQVSRVQNTISGFYRYEKGNSAKEVYLPDKKEGASVEAFNFDSLINHNRERKNMQTLHSGVIQTEADVTWNQFKDFHLDGIPAEELTLLKNVSIITGTPKAGKSSLAVALSLSLLKESKQSLILDFTDNQDCFETFSNKNDCVDCYEMKSFLTENIIHEKPIVVTKFNSNSLYGIRLDVLVLILNKKLDEYDNIFLVCEPRDLSDVFQLIFDRLHRLFFCAFAFKNEIEKYRDALIMHSADVDVFLMLSDRLRLNKYTTFLEAEAVKSLVGDSLRVVKPLDLEDFDVIEDIHVSLLGG